MATCPKEVTEQVVMAARKRCTAEDYHLSLAHSFPFFQQFSRHEALLVAADCHRVADPRLGREWDETHLDNQFYQLKHKPTHLLKYLCCHRPGTPNVPLSLRRMSEPSAKTVSTHKGITFMLLGSEVLG